MKLLSILMVCLVCCIPYSSPATCEAQESNGAATADTIYEKLTTFKSFGLKSLCTKTDDTANQITLTASFSGLFSSGPFSMKDAYLNSFSTFARSLHMLAGVKSSSEVKEGMRLAYVGSPIPYKITITLEPEIYAVLKEKLKAKCYYQHLFFF